jgi:hypothetical protein
MRQLGALLCLLILASACGGVDTLPAGPSTVRSPATTVPSSDPTPVPSPAPPTPQVISVGKEVKDSLTLHGTADRLFELTAPSNGTLVVRVDWDPKQGRLQLDLADRQFANSPDNRSPIVGKLSVVASGKYRVRVSDGAPWDYDNLFLPFVLTTSIE